MNRFMIITAVTAVVNFIDFNTPRQHLSNVESVSYEYFDIRFENKCSADIKLRIEATGSASEATVYKNSYETKPVQPGNKIFVNGKFLVEITSGHKGKSLTICQ
jgi:hypothetical protein